MDLVQLPQSIPLKIAHRAGEFEIANSQSRETLGSKIEDAVPIGLVRKRVLFLKYADKPNVVVGCKSNDGEHPHPNKNFPSPNKPTLCSTCNYRTNVSEQPYTDPGTIACSNSWDMILLIEGKVHILSVSGSSVKEVARYAKYHQVHQTPLFVNLCSLHLEVAKSRNGTRYSQLSIKRGSETNQEAWVSEYLPLYREWTDILSQAPSKPAPSPAGGLTALD